METAALKCEGCDDLMRYAKKLNALGHVIGSLAFHKDEELTWKGEDLGGIISDYANAIENTLSRFYKAIDQALRGEDTSFLSGLKRTHDLLQQGAFTPPGTLSHAKEALEKIDQHMERELEEMTELRAKFKWIAEEAAKRLEAGSKQKRASASSVDGQEAETPGADLDRSESHSKVA